MNPEQPPQKLTVKGLRDLGATKLADTAEATINRLREAGAPDVSEDQVIRSILERAAKSQGSKVNSANRIPETPGPLSRFLKLTAICAVSVLVSAMIAFVGENLLEMANAPEWLTNLFGVALGSFIVGIIALWINSIWRILLRPP